jgi:hypothetical protein
MFSYLSQTQVQQTQVQPQQKTFWTGLKSILKETVPVAQEYLKYRQAKIQAKYMPPVSTSVAPKAPRTAAVSGGGFPTGLLLPIGLGILALVLLTKK